MDNSRGQNPCLVAAYVQGACQSDGRKEVTGIPRITTLNFHISRMDSSIPTQFHCHILGTRHGSNFAVYLQFCGMGSMQRMRLLPRRWFTLVRSSTRTLILMANSPVVGLIG